MTEAAAVGAARVRAKMAEAVELARLHGQTVVDRALGQAGTSGRFAEGDLAAILSHQASAAPGRAGRAGEGHTLAQGTAGWAEFGEPDLGQTGVGETEFTRYFAGHPTREQAVWMGQHIAERIAALLDGDRGQP